MDDYAYPIPNKRKQLDSSEIQANLGAEYGRTMAAIVNRAAAVKAIENILVDAGADVVAGLDAAFAQKIASTEWQWPRPTRRRNGRTVNSPRDIIDTGELDSSQQLTRVSRVEWRWDWTADHALLVHEGFTLRSGGEYPARPWTERAVADYRPVQKFAQEVRRRV